MTSVSCLSLMRRHCRDVRNNYLIKKRLKINLLALRLMRDLHRKQKKNKIMK